MFFRPKIRPIPKPGLGLRLVSFVNVSHRTKNPTRSQSTFTEKRHHLGIEAVEGKIDIDSFRKLAWDPKIPLLLEASHRFSANKKWFQFSEKGHYPSFSPYFLSFSDEVFPYEFTTPRISQHDEPNSAHEVLQAFLQWLTSCEDKGFPQSAMSETMVKSIIRDMHSQSPFTFQQFDAPAALMIAACRFNENRDPRERLTKLYIAQSDLSHLPKPLFEDLPVPDIVKCAGKGDVYSSSIWLGLQPTYTPLHRDPNPNLFCQLVGSKRIRLMTSDRGDEIYADVRKKLGLNGNSRFRGAEMMEGRERQLLHDAVWGDATISEVLVKPTDALFIPMGWWHSVASDGTEGNLNASVNWWFR